MSLAPHKHGAKMFIWAVASELSEQHILKPNKIMQLSNLKPRLAAKTILQLNGPH